MADDFRTGMLEEEHKRDLHLAILGYLKASGHEKSYHSLAAALPDLKEKPEHRRLLIDNWRAIARIQKACTELEAHIKDLEDEKKKKFSKENSEVEPLPRGPARFTLEKHKRCVTSVKFHPKFALLASASEDASIQFWDTDSGRADKTLTGHQDAVNCIAFAPKGFIASCSADMTIKIWELEQFQCTKTIQKGHDHNISAVVYNWKGDTLYSCSRDKTVKAWDVATGVCKRTFKGHSEWVRQLAVSPDRMLVASCADDKTIKLWPAVEGEDCVGTMEGHEKEIECIIFSTPQADNFIIKKLLSQEDSGWEREHKAKWKEEHQGKGEVSSFLISGSRDRTIKIWSVARGRCLRTIERAHDNWVRGLALHPSGRFLLSCSDDKTIKVWDLSDDLKCFRKLDQAHSLFVSCVDMSNVMLLMASGGVDGTVKIWECKAI